MSRFTNCFFISSFCAFGRPGSHMSRYMSNLNVREADYKQVLEMRLKAGKSKAIIVDGHNG